MVEKHKRHTHTTNIYTTIHNSIYKTHTHIGNINGPKQKKNPNNNKKKICMFGSNVSFEKKRKKKKKSISMIDLFNKKK